MEDNVVEFERQVAKFFDSANFLFDVGVHLALVRLLLAPMPD